LSAISTSSRSLAGGCAAAGLGLATPAHAAAHVEETDVVRVRISEDLEIALAWEHGGARELDE